MLSIRHPWLPRRAAATGLGVALGCAACKPAPIHDDRGNAITNTASRAKRSGHPLAAFRNVGRAALMDFAALGIADADQLAAADADELYARLCALTAQRHDPCVHDVFTATIHQARTGEPVDWWHFTPARKLRQAAGEFPPTPAPGALAPARS